MKKLICLLLACSVFLAGCAGRTANPVRVHQLGDQEKTCKDIITEMYYIEEEIERLLPHSDKTGSNIALGAAGLFFIIPLFFMDLKQGEKKEIVAYRQRYNYLLMLTKQRDCKVKQVSNEIVSDGQLQDSETITITVNNMNRPPALDPIGNKSISENDTLAFSINATDPDGDAITCSVQNMPSGAALNPINKIFSWKPNSNQAGTYQITFIVSDGRLADSETITITVSN